MKKTIITILMLGSMAMGATLTYSQYEDAGLKDELVAAWSFDSGSAADTSTTLWSGEFVTTSSGTGKIGRIDDVRNIVSTTGDDLTNSAFTLSLDLVSYSSTHKWKNIFTLYAGNNSGLVLTRTDNDAYSIYSYGFGGTQDFMSEIVGFGTSTEPINFTVTYDGTNLVTYINGSESMTTEASLTDGLTGVYFGAGVNGERPIDSGYSGTHYAELDNIALWNKALTAEQVKMVATGQIVPEPATATLSLLALCGLAVRRRRK